LVPRRCWHRWGRAGVRMNVRSNISVENLFYLPVRPVRELFVEDAVELYDYEVEAFALIHYEGLTTEEAAARMNLSKTTFWRILEQARSKLAKALVEHKPIKITPSEKAIQE